YGVRFAIDTLLDPATYVTFGASRGVLGVSALTKIKAPKAAIEAFELSSKTKNIALKEGSGDVLYNLSSAKLRGDTDTVARLSEELISKYKVPKEELDSIIKNLDDTIDEGLIQFMDSDVLSAQAAGEAVTNLFRVAPDLMKPFMDKGGIKFFGTTILEGQKMRAVANRIPGTTALADAVQPFRESFSSLFDARMKRVDGEYLKISDENFNWVQSIKNKGRQGKADLMKQFEITFRENGIKSEAEQLAVWRAVKEWQLPADPRLANAYKSIMGING